jgi:arylsulfatase A-like enzyme
VPAAQVTAEAQARIESHPPNQPFFIYVHVTDPHAPYAPSTEFRSRFAPDVTDPKLSEYQFLHGVTDFSIEPTEALRDDLLALYDAEIAFVDREFGRLLDFLRERGLYDDMLIVFVADHGEEFLDHGWWAHGKTLYEEQLRVPLIVKFPRGWMAGRWVSQPVQQVDIVPTLLGYLGMPASESLSFDGIDLTRLINGGRIGDREILASLDLDGRVVEAIVSGRWKLIDTVAYAHPRNLRPGTQLFDLDADPGERYNLAEQHPVVVDYLRTRFAALYHQRAQRLEKSEAEVDDETMKNLRALGYFGE